MNNEHSLSSEIRWKRVPFRLAAPSNTFLFPNEVGLVLPRQHQAIVQRQDPHIGSMKQVHL